MDGSVSRVDEADLPGPSANGRSEAAVAVSCAGAAELVTLSVMAARRPGF
jgi:hypothetical protein